MAAIVAEAIKAKLGTGDPRLAGARKLDKAFGADGARNQAISNQVTVEIAALDSARADATVARAALQARATTATVADGRKKLAALKAQTLKLERAYLAYRAILYEADAHEVGDSESEAFSRLP